MAGVPEKTSFFLSKPLFSKLGKINGKARLEIQFSGSVFLKITLGGSLCRTRHLGGSWTSFSSCFSSFILLGGRASLVSAQVLKLAGSAGLTSLWGSTGITEASNCIWLFMWVLEIELTMSGLLGNHLYALSHLTAPEACSHHAWDPELKPTNQQTHLSVACPLSKRLRIRCILDSSFILDFGIFAYLT